MTAVIGINTFTRNEMQLIISVSQTLYPKESADVVGCRRSSSGHISIIDSWNSNFAKVNVLEEPQVQMTFQEQKLVLLYVYSTYYFAG